MPGHDDRPDTPRDGGLAEQAGCRSVGGFRLLRRVGSGAMSHVFLGYDPANLRRVAVKLLADHLADDRQYVNRFHREARMSRLLTHPHIVHGIAHGYDHAAAKHYLILEYVDGPNAMALMARLGRLPVGTVVRVGIEIGQALQHLHALGYVHRDVKPENVLIGPDGSAKLGDLGLAKRLSGDAGLTAMTQGVGTPHYMPYEQAVNGDLVDGRSDLFALGATLYHLLTGQVPFRGESHEEMIREKAQGTYRPAAELRPDVPRVLDHVLARTLACDPRARYQSAAQLVAALRETGLASSGGLPLDPPGEGADGTDVDPPPASRTRADLQVLPPVRVPRWPAALGLLLAALALFGSARAAVRLISHDQSPAPAHTGGTARVPGSPLPADSQ